VCDLETSRMGAPYIYDISRLRVKDLHSATYIYVVRRLRVKNMPIRFMALDLAGILKYWNWYPPFM